MSIDYGKFEIFQNLMGNAYQFNFTSVDEIIKATDKVYKALEEKDCCDPIYKQRYIAYPALPDNASSGAVSPAGMYHTM